METVPKVSVAMLAYNQASFIAQAVESALMQTTDFDFEIVIGEDCSNDGTRELASELARRAPDRIRLLLNPRNLGMQTNLVQTLSACRGRYIALLEADDYWTDPSKLRQQADLLDRRPDVAICHHNAMLVSDNGSLPPSPRHLGGAPRLATLDELMKGNFLVTCTAMFRAGLFDVFPEWFYECRMGDWPLHVLNARYGNIAYLAKTMAVYRIHAGGAWSAQTNLGRFEGLIQTAEAMRGVLDARRQRRLSKTVLRWRADVADWLFSEGRFAEARRYAQAHLSRSTGARLRHFYQALEEERAGRRGAATVRLLKAAAQPWPRCRIGARDITLAAGRVTFPRLYRACRACWRRWSSPGPPGPVPSAPHAQP